ncbi:MAG: LacI family DNA-binding transcriptional regulator [Microbacteriaceae bacterium]|tara:strand:+ start:12122 stop:13135 length:1014 start_codon:yes stop_codon:yes gene_type:complete
MPASRPTILDVASLAGVSKSLVSLALSGSPKVSERSKKRILQAVEELGYRPNAAARSLAVNKSRTLGVLVLDLHNPVFAEILDGVQTEVRQHGFTTMLVTGGDDPSLERADIETLQQFQIEGLILISHRLTATMLREIAADVPTVTVTRDDISLPRMDMVCNDDVAGAKLAVDHLVSLGHSRIVCLSGGDNPVSHSRSQGYTEAMAEHGLSQFAQIVSGGLTDTAGYSAAKQGLGLSPTAFFVANDIGAMGAIAAVEEEGLEVPGDISVIGYDGIRLAGLRSVNLTTVAQPLGDLGRLAARRLLERLDNPTKKSQHDLVASRLIVRGTTGPVALAKN